MTEPPLHQALIYSTTEQLAAVTAIVGEANVQRLVMGDNGVPSFYHEGFEILDEIAQALPETERDRLKSWDELDDDTRLQVLGYTAGCEELDIRYFANLLDNLPDFKTALLHPADHQPS